MKVNERTSVGSTFANQIHQREKTMGKGGHVWDVRKESVFDMCDQDHSGSITQEEFGRLYDVVKQEAMEEIEKERVLEKTVAEKDRKLKLVAFVVALLTIFLAVSLAGGAALTFWVVDQGVPHRAHRPPLLANPFPHGLRASPVPPADPAPPATIADHDEGRFYNRQPAAQGRIGLDRQDGPRRGGRATLPRADAHQGGA